MGSVSSRPKPGSEDIDLPEGFKVPKHHPPRVIEEEVVLNLSPCVVNGNVILTGCQNNIFKTIVDRLFIGHEYEEKFAVLSHIKAEVKRNETGCSFFMNLEKVFDDQGAKWLNGDTYFTQEDHDGKVSSGSLRERQQKDSRYLSIQKSLADPSKTGSYSFGEVDTRFDPSLTEEEKVGERPAEKKQEKSEENAESSEEESEQTASRREFNERVYGGKWDPSMDPKKNRKKKISMRVPKEPQKESSLIYNVGIDPGTLIAAFGVTEGTLAQVRWDPTGDTVTYDKDHHMVKWIKNPDNQRTLGFSEKQVIEKEDGSVQIPKRFYHEANRIVQRQLVSKIHYTQLNNTEMSFEFEFANQEEEFQMEWQREFNEKRGDQNQLSQFMNKYGICIKFTVSAVIGSKKEGYNYVSTKDGPFWVS